MKNKTMFLLATVILLTTITGCSKKTSSEQNTNKTLKIAGSTSVAPLMKEIKTEYEAENTDITIEIQESGSSSGISATIEGASNVGMSSRDLKESEKEKGLVDTIVAIDGIAIIVNKQNEIENLTKEQLTSIYKGEIKNWSEVGGKDGKIVVVSREEGSGTRGAYEELIEIVEGIEKNGKKLLSSKVSEDALFENSTGAVKGSVAGNKNAIGYISFGTLDNTIKEINIDGVSCNEENIKNKTYEIARAFIVCTVGEPSGDAKLFIDYILSDIGQKIVSTHNYISVN